MALPEFLSKIVDWLRAGYPEGVPEHDYIPLFALLGSQLTNDEVTVIGDELCLAADPQSADAIKKAIAAVSSHGTPNDADIARVRAHLAAGGWPLAAAARGASRLVTYHGSSRPSLVNVPVGPPLGSVIAQTTLAAP